MFNHPEWSKNATIYEVNLRQYSDEGSIQAFEAHLPRLKALGVDILWLMPIHPVGVSHRKGTLGSEYAAQDYLEIDPSFGTKADFRHLVEEIHSLGMKVIIDWVANHTAWDHVWVKEHPEWYKKNDKGEIYEYTFFNGTDYEYWSDVIGLDYTQPGLWNGMLDALTYWVKTFDIDGYRCDVAGLVPTLFWEKARLTLDQIKPVFMLAEWSTPELHRKAFDMTYDWTLHDTMRDIAKGLLPVRSLIHYTKETQKLYPKDAYRMLFTSNHDKNSWEHSDTELYKEGFFAYSVLTFTLPGMPLIYSGQESMLDKRISFFEKDPIDWKNYENTAFYQELIQLRKNNPALWSGQYGGTLTLIDVANDAVFAFTRKLHNNEITVFVNLSDKPQKAAHLALKPYEYVIKTANN